MEYKGFLWEFMFVIFGFKDVFSNIIFGWFEWKYFFLICKYRIILRILLRLFIFCWNVKIFVNKEYN